MMIMGTIVDSEYARSHVRANYRYKPGRWHRASRARVNERESSIELLHIRRAIFENGLPDARAVSVDQKERSMNERTTENEEW